MIMQPSGPTLEQLAEAEAKKPTIIKPAPVKPAKVEKPAVEDLEMDLPESVINTLIEAGYADPDLVAAASDDDLLALPGIGPAMLKQLRQAIP